MFRPLFHRDRSGAGATKTRHLLIGLVLAFLCASTQAQVTFTSRTSGIIASDGELPGVLSADAGTPFTLEVTSVFPETTPWSSWPDWIDTEGAQSHAVFTIGGASYEYSGTSRMVLQVRTEPHDTNRRVVHVVTMPLPGTQDLIGFGSFFYLSPEATQASLFSLFASAQPYLPLSEGPNVSVIYLFPDEGDQSLYIMGSVNSVSYATAGTPLAPAVPEPSVAAMLLAGLALAARRFRGV
ncbi:MAG TPA: PEP-CTERM sorting domain-containing protein [Telluria sp.]|nr:PEP-CTERM sorting domain-containing protein [Telluria sp.]